MASMGSLKTSMALTMVLVFGLLFALMMFVFEGIYYYYGTGFSFILQVLVVTALVSLFMLMQWAIGPAIVRWSTGLRYLKPGENVFLERAVGELAQKAGVPMPKLAIVEDKSPNAFVFGRTLASSTLAVTKGLLERLNSEEVKAVLAHEIGHLKHRDVIIMTFAGAIPLIAYFIARMLMFSGGRRSKDSGGLVIVGIVALVVYVISQFLVLRLSRLREFYADSYAGTSTGRPRALASALAKITYGLSLAPKEQAGAARAFYIGDPQSAASNMKEIQQLDLNGDGVLDDRELQIAAERGQKGRSTWARAGEISSTHPSTYKRIMLLLEIDKDLQSSGAK
jgi:heat shock protein HtpX